ncbi:MAG: hypothetical protein ACLQPH_04215 [Acidimicrobiales bacterium]
MRAVDWIIGASLLVLLGGLLGLGLANQSDPSATASAAVRQSSTGTLGSHAPVGGAAGSSPLRTAGADPDPTPDPSAPTSTSTSTTTTTSSSTVAPVAGPVSAIGDSIMLDIQSYLQADIPGVNADGMVSRQFETGISIVAADRAAGTLGTVLVVELGTNGTVTSSDFDAMMQAAAGVQRVVFVNVDVPRPWEAPDNAVLAAGVARYPRVAVLADWYDLSSAHPEWFTPDQVHLEPTGAQALAALIAQFA